MLKHVEKTRRRTNSSVTAQLTAIAVGCAVVAGGVSAGEISMLNHSQADTSVSYHLEP